MVKAIDYRIMVNGANVTAKISPLLVQMRITDNDKNESDELSLTLSVKFKRPAFGDQIKIYINERFVGLFHVQKTTIRNNQELTVTATGINYNSDIKVRRHKRIEKVSLGGLARGIADLYGLAVKTDADNIKVDIDQVNESDLNLLNRQAKEHDMAFNIKNSTIYFMKKETSVSIPVVDVDIAQCTESEITHKNTSQYESCKVVYQDTKQNKTVSVNIGSGKPQLTKQGHFKSEEEAKRHGKNALGRANQGTAEGSLTMAGRVVFSGSRLNVDGGQYNITRVEHNLNNSGWLTSLEFTNSSKSKK